MPGQGSPRWPVSKALPCGLPPIRNFRSEQVAIPSPLPDRWRLVILRPQPAGWPPRPTSISVAAGRFTDRRPFPTAWPRRASFVVSNREGKARGYSNSTGNVGRPADRPPFVEQAKPRIQQILRHPSRPENGCKASVEKTQCRNMSRANQRLAPNRKSCRCPSGCPEPQPGLAKPDIFGSQQALFAPNIDGTAWFQPRRTGRRGRQSFARSEFALDGRTDPHSQAHTTGRLCPAPATFQTPPPRRIHPSTETPVIVKGK